MHDNNEGAELKRLADLYADMTEVELRDIAAEKSTLTPVGQQALTSELARRGLDIAPERVPDVSAEREDSDPGESIVLRQFRDLPEALVARSILESAEIECWFGDDNLVRMDWLISNAIGGIKLCVRRTDADAASMLLDQNSSDVSA
jgi:hypothetical protein